MLQPDVALTDLMLAALCGCLAALALRGTKGDGGVRRGFAALYAALGTSALLGGIWHGFFSGADTEPGNVLWILTMLTLGLASWALWWIASRLAPSRAWRRGLSAIGPVQFAVYAMAVLFVTRSFALAGAMMLPPVAVLAGMLAARYRRGPSRRLQAGLAGLLLVIVAGALQQAGVALPLLGLSANGLYHVLQSVAVLLVFLSVPDLRPYPR
jgi:hypothetical protein